MFSMADFLDLMQRGGPVMWVIFVVAWLAFIMLIERVIRINLWKHKAQRDYDNLLSQASFDEGTIANASSNASYSPVGVISSKLTWGEIRHRDDLVEQLNIQFAELMPKLEGTLPTIAIIGSLLPMLGLLGTVTGMIEVFEVIALQGTGEPQEMAGGISQALLTTASGLIIAIPVIFAHHLLVRQLRHVLTLTEQSMHVIVTKSNEIKDA